MPKKRKRKIVICIAFAILGCVFIFFILFSFTLKQQGDIIVYRGVEYKIAPRMDFIAQVELDGYRRIGYAKLNLFPYIAVYAPMGKTPDFLVFEGGRRICFAEGKYPDELDTEYAKMSAETSGSLPVEHNSPINLSKEICQIPNTYPESDPASDLYSYCILLKCYLQIPNNTYRMIDIYENGGTYYLRVFGDDRKADDYERYYAIIEGSSLHTLILETMTTGQSNQ